MSLVIEKHSHNDQSLQVTHRVVVAMVLLLFPFAARLLSRMWLELLVTAVGLFRVHSSALRWAATTLPSHFVQH